MNSDSRPFGSVGLCNALALAILPPRFRLADGSGPRGDGLSSDVWDKSLEQANEILALARSRAVNVDRWAAELEAVE